MRRLRGRNGPLTKESFLTMTSAAALIAASVTIAAPARADDAVNQRWIDSEFQPSTLSKADQLKELQWFEKAAAPFKGCLLYTSPSPRDRTRSRMPSSA